MNGMSQSLSQTSGTILGQFMQIPPTITIRPGNRVKVFLTQDLLLPAYSNHTISPNFCVLTAHQREVSQPLLSQHLRVLRDAGMVTTTRVGTEITYRLADDRIAHLVEDAIHHASRAGTA